MLATFIHSTILNQKTLENAVIARIAERRVEFLQGLHADIASDGGLDARRVQPLQGQQPGRIAMLDEDVRKSQMQHRLEHPGRLQRWSFGGLRLLLVGYESGDDQILHNIKKGLKTDIARRFNADCHKLGIKIHGTFILGLPGETRETIEKSIEFAKEINPHTIQVSQIGRAHV